MHAGALSLPTNNVRNRARPASVGRTAYFRRIGPLLVVLAYRTCLKARRSRTMWRFTRDGLPGLL